jgi:TrwC relaxase
MLTVCKMNMVAGDDQAALAEAEDMLEFSLSPQALGQTGSRAAARANSMWLGSAEVLRRFGVRRGAEVLTQQAALVLQGRHTITKAQVIQPQNGIVRSYEVTFWAPESLAWIWTQSKEKLQAQIEQAVGAAADYALTYLTQSGLAGPPARGFGASTVLHVRTWTVDEETGVPGPLLHVHSHLAAVLEADKILKAPNGQVLFGNDAILAAGAVGRSVLAEKLRKLGFGIEPMTGPQRRYFEVVGVPKELLRADAWRLAECTHTPVLRGLREFPPRDLQHEVCHGVSTGRVAVGEQGRLGRIAAGC